MNLYKKIIVNNWIDNSESNIRKYEIYVYEDDSLENAIAKIAHTISTDKGRFYAWKNRSILFNIKEIKWDGYSPNPIKATNKQSSQLNEAIIHDYNYGLFSFSFINIIFEDDFPDLANNSYYFTDKTFLSLSQLNKKENILKNLEKVDTQTIIDTSLNIHRYELISKMKKTHLLIELFERLNTTTTIQFIQWVNDNYKIMYKLLKFNKLSKEMLQDWTDVKKINQINCINCYSILASGTYAKLTIKDNMELILSYTINLRKNIKWDEINSNISSIQKYCATIFREKIVFGSLSIKAKLIIEIENVTMQNLKKKISEYVDIFDILKSNKETINLIYKRASNYSNQGFDANLYVKNCLYLGIDDKDIIEQLVILNNMTEPEAKTLLKEEQELIYEMEQQNIKKQETINKTDTIVIIKLYKNGFYLEIINIPNKKELDNIIYWISKIIASATQKTVKRKKDQDIEEVVYRKKSSSTPRKDSEDDIGKLSYATSSDGSKSLSSSKSSKSSKSGGALGKDKHSYFINLLQKADKDLFSENYARKKCQAINQPVVFTEEYRNKLKADGNYHFDNDVVYGSKENIKNVYACPRLWCPQSKVPLDPTKDDQTCPIEGEEPMELFFDNNKDKKRYVKLIKPDEKNICAPCCFKKMPREEELTKCKNYTKEVEPKTEEKAIIITKEELPPIVENNKDENYLVNVSPVRVGRFGVIPQSLHELLLPNTKYSVCSKMLNKSDKCFVRKGIQHRTSKKLKNIYNDSLINSIAIGLGFEPKEVTRKVKEVTKNDKKEIIKTEMVDKQFIIDAKEIFIQDLNKRLDLITFMSLENGNVCKAFIDKLPIIPENNKSLIKELEEHLIKFKLISLLTSIDFKKNNYKLSRLLGIFKSYKKFMLYLTSNDYPTNKYPYYLYSLISTLYNVLLLIWEKQNELTTILCPYYVSYDDLIASMELNPKLLMILKEKTYFEPIELKIKGKEGEKLVKLNDYNHIKNLFKECSILKHEYEESNKLYNNIYSLNSWINSSVLGIKNKFIIDTIIINSDLSITHFLTKGNILLITDKINISFLPRFIKDLVIKNIVFYDDIIDNKYDINVLIKDYELFINKCANLSINYDFGESNETTAKEYYYTLTIKKQALTNDIIHSQIIDDIYKYQLLNKNRNKKWYQLQNMIFIKIIKLADEKFDRLLQLPKKERIIQLFKELDLSKIPEKNKIRVILEEIPFISKKHILKYLNDYIIYYKYDFLNPLIKESKKQFIFSQISLQNSIPSQLIIYHPYTPNNVFNSFQSKDYIFNTKEEEIISELPEMFKGNFEKLNSKWSMHKKSKWSNMVIIKNDKYDRNFIKNFYLWLANFLNIKIDYDDLVISAYEKMKSIFSIQTMDKEDMVKCQLKNLFEDSKFLGILNKILGKKYVNFNIFWDKYYSIASVNDRKILLNEILQTNELYPNDYYILAMSNLLNINIITIHRSKYGANKEDEKEDKVIRGDVSDLLLSSTFYKAPTTNYENRPVIMLNKNDDGGKIIYSLIVDKTIPLNENVIYKKIHDLPLEIKELISQHTKQQTNKKYLQSHCV